MLCYTARRLISLEIDGRLPAERTVALEEHLGRCDDCRTHRAELDLGRRFLRASAAEPSDAFEWKLQLKLNRALQEAAASRSVPWEEAPRSAGGWWRGFAASSLGGLAVTALVALFLWPGAMSRPDTGTVVPAVAASSASVRPHVASSLFADRLPLRTGRARAVNLGGGLLGRPVSEGLLSEHPISTPIVGGRLGNFNASSALRAENARLRAALEGLRGENSTLKELLAARGIAYLEEDSLRTER